MMSDVFMLYVVHVKPVHILLALHYKVILLPFISAKREYTCIIIIIHTLLYYVYGAHEKPVGSDKK